MLKNAVLTLMCALILSACVSGKPKLMGMDGSEIPPAFSHFPDIPFPERSYIDLEETRVLGSGEVWIGSIAFNTPYSPSSVFDFYMSEMPKLAWEEVATVRARISTMTYVRQNRAVQILIEHKFMGKSYITITAIPSKPGA